MARIPPLLVDWMDEADGRFASMAYRAASVKTAGVRTALRKARRPFVDPDAKQQPTVAELDATARWIIVRASSRAGLRGGVVGLAGAISVPTEATSHALASLRLAQRLAIVYGLDPETDRGRMATWRAVAAGWGMAMPDRGTLQGRAFEIARPQSVGARLVRGVLSHATRHVSERTARLLPVISGPIAARRAQRNAREVGRAAWHVLRALAGWPGEPVPVEEAQEV
jgi:hypothetical protein